MIGCMVQMNRITRLESIREMVGISERRSTCERAQVGAIATNKGGRHLISGYNGAPSGEPHCCDVGCDIHDGGCIRTVHAEANVIAMAAKQGIPLRGTIMYCTYSPCRVCAPLILNSGIKAVFFFNHYRDTRGIELLEKHIVIEYIPKHQKHMPGITF